MSLPKSSDSLLTTRLWFFSLAWAHSLIVVVYALRIDLSQDDNPKIAVYARLKYRLITTWFSLLNLIYFPLCIYCDWKEKTGEGNLKHVATFRKIQDFLLTSCLFPVITFADILFWKFYITNFNYICTPDILKYIPFWLHHALHTVSTVVAALDLMLVPRRRPRSMIPGIAVMTAYVVANSLVILDSFLRGEMVYSILEILSGRDSIIFWVLCYVGCLFFYTLQWFIIDFFWGSHMPAKKTS